MLARDLQLTQGPLMGLLASAGQGPWPRTKLVLARDLQLTSSGTHDALASAGQRPPAAYSQAPGPPS